MKFLHTADWQIGMKAAHVGGAGERVREERLNTVLRLVDVAAEYNVDFMLVAGDVFEDNGVARVLVQRVADAMARSQVSVFVIPGNHDPLIPGSVWEHPAWRSAVNVKVLKLEEPIEVPGGVLYPCPVREKRCDRDPTAWINTSEQEGIRIGLAHGTVEGIHVEEPDYPIPRDAAARRSLDYLALGHWHSVTTYEVSDGSVRMAYSGTPEPTKFGERDSGKVLIVDIRRKGEVPVITPVQVGDLEWLVIERDLRGLGDLVCLREELESIDRPDSTLLELKITGLLAAEDTDELARIREIVDARFAFARIDSSKVKPLPEDENWVANLPAGILREAAARLRALADTSFAEERPEGASPEVAARALVELHAMTVEAQP